MYISSGFGIARMKERKGWVLAGAFVAAVLMGARYEAHSPMLRSILAAGAFIAVGLAVWLFNRGPLKTEKKKA